VHYYVRKYKYFIIIDNYYSSVVVKTTLMEDCKSYASSVVIVGIAVETSHDTVSLFRIDVIHLHT